MKSPGFHTIAPHSVQLLTQFLASPQRPKDTMTYHEAQGLLFAIACAPELVKPSEWIPLIFNEQEACYESMEEAQSVMQVLMDLYNVINTQVFTGNVAIPDDIICNEPALENVGEATALGQWSRGFLQGHDWLIELWDHYTPDELDEELGSSLMILSFFSNKKLAEAYYQETVTSRAQTQDEFAETIMGMFEIAMGSYAHLGRSIQTAQAGQLQAESTYVREQKIGRNDPCPCGSGKKFKNCCLQ
ncbi:MAG: UPF0149 family protein [Gammaproteobacteria bacterium]|nr:UPF0149 family protein [Gammaproteobacteria bacterium]